MNEQKHHDQRLLETMTSRSLAPGEPLAPGQQELRAMWLAMGQALDEENADFREAELLARLQSRPEFHVALPELALPELALAELPLPERPAPRAVVRGRVWPALLASALALSLLMVFMQSSWFSDPASVAIQPGSNSESTGSWSDDALTWSDALDDELDAARERVSGVAQGTGVDDSLANLADHLESLSDDLRSSSL
jgi:hypothetical protein